MGLLIQAQFETPEGLSVSSVYCRIGRIILDPAGSSEYTITMYPWTYVSREQRLRQKRVLQIPGLPTTVSFQGAVGDMASFYGRLKTHLETLGHLVEDVFEPTPEASPQSS